MKKPGFLIGAFLMVVVFACIAAVFQNRFTSTPDGSLVNGNVLTNLDGTKVTGTLTNNTTGNAATASLSGGFTNTLNSTENLIYTNFDGQPALLILEPRAVQTNTSADTAVEVFFGTSAIGSGNGFFYPLISTNYSAGKVILSIYTNAAGQIVTNCIQDAKFYFVGTTPAQSGLGLNIGRGFATHYLNSGCWAVGSFSGGHQNEGVVFNTTNYFWHFPRTQSTNYDGTGDNWGQDLLTIDELHGNIMITNCNFFESKATNFLVFQSGSMTLPLATQIFASNAVVRFTNYLATQVGSSSAGAFVPVFTAPSDGGASGGFTMGFRGGTDRPWYLGDVSHILMQWSFADGTTNLGTFGSGGAITAPTINLQNAAGTQKVWICADGSSGLGAWASDLLINTLFVTNTITVSNIIGGVTMTLNTTGTATFNTSKFNETIYNTNSTLLAALTITLPATGATAKGQIVRYVGAEVVTSVTVSGSVVVGSALTSLAANSSVAWQAVNTTGDWVRIQ